MPIQSHAVRGSIAGDQPATERLRPESGLLPAVIQRQPEARLVSNAYVPPQMPALCRPIRQSLGSIKAMRLTAATLSAPPVGDPTGSGQEIWLLRPDQGTLELDQCGRHATTDGQEWLILDASRPYQLKSGEDFAGLCVRIPKDKLLTRVANVEGMSARTLSESAPMASLASRLILEALMLELDGESATAVHLANAIVDTLAAALDCYAAEAELGAARNVNLLDRAKSLMLANIEDSDLTINGVAEQIGVSRRTLNRLFNAEETTPTRWLWARRLELSKSLLESSAGQRVTDVALNCGFSDFSHFSRAFKSRFGMTPRSLLAASAS